MKPHSRLKSANHVHKIMVCSGGKTWKVLISCWRERRKKGKKNLEKKTS